MNSWKNFMQIYINHANLQCLVSLFFINFVHFVTGMNPLPIGHTITKRQHSRPLPSSWAQTRNLLRSLASLLSSLRVIARNVIDSVECRAFSRHEAKRSDPENEPPAVVCCFTTTFPAAPRQRPRGPFIAARES